MKTRYFRLFLVLSVIAVTAFLLWKSITPKQELTKEEAVEKLTDYLQALDEYDSGIAVCDDEENIIREWPSEDGSVMFQISSEGLGVQGACYIFGYYSRFNAGQCCPYYSLIDYYAVNRETGEIIAQQEWAESDATLNNSNAGLGMSEEEAMKVFFSKYFPVDTFDSKGDSYRNKVGHLAYQWWDESHDQCYFWCHGLSEKKDYYIFEYWSDLYGEDMEGKYEFTRSYYWGSYAVNKWTGEIVEERIEDPETYLWSYKM